MSRTVTSDVSRLGGATTPRWLAALDPWARALRSWQLDERDRHIAGFAVLAVWGDSGRHDLFDFTPRWDTAVRRSRRRRRAWARPGPYPRPRISVVATTRFEVRSHDRDGCGRSDCRWT